MPPNTSALGCKLDINNNSKNNNNNHLAMLKILYLILFNPYNEMTK